MAEQLSAEQRATALVVRYGRDGTLHDTRQWIELAIQAAEKQAREKVREMCVGVAKLDADQKHWEDNFRSQDELNSESRAATRIMQTIQKLNLTKDLAPSRGEEKGNG